MVPPTGGVTRLPTEVLPAVTGEGYRGGSEGGKGSDQSELGPVGADIYSPGVCPPGSCSYLPTTWQHLPTTSYVHVDDK